MFRSVLVRAALCLVLCGSLHAQRFSGKVVAVKDGDTIEVLRSGKAVTVRLHGVDAPEKAQPFGDRARKFTSDAVFGKTVVVDVTDVDRYGRSVGIVLHGRQSLNASLVSAGLAWWYREYAPKDGALRNLEAGARRSRRGLWADARPVAPWDWRRAGRRPSTTRNAATSPRTRTSRAAKPAGFKDRDCGDFRTQQEAQAFFRAAGAGDPHQLDRDGNGRVCESLP